MLYLKKNTKVCLAETLSSSSVASTSSQMRAHKYVPTCLDMRDRKTKALPLYFG